MHCYTYIFLEAIYTVGNDINIMLGVGIGTYMI